MERRRRRFGLTRVRLAVLRALADALGRPSPLADTPNPPMTGTTLGS